MFDTFPSEAIRRSISDRTFALLEAQRSRTNRATDLRLVLPRDIEEEGFDRSARARPFLFPSPTVRSRMQDRLRSQTRKDIA